MANEVKKVGIGGSKFPLLVHFKKPTSCQMRFEVVVINYYFYNAKMSLALKLKLPALLGILGLLQAWGAGRGTKGRFTDSGPGSLPGRRIRGGGKITYFNNLR